MQRTYTGGATPRSEIPPTMDPDPAEPREAGRALDRTAERIDEIAEAADRAAAELRDGGDLPQGLARSLEERTEQLRAEARELAGILDRAVRLLHGSSANGGPEARGHQEPPAADSSPSGAVHVSEGIRLLVTQMLVAGSSREQIARRLGEEFGVHHSEAVLDEVLGPQAAATEL